MSLYLDATLRVGGIEEKEEEEYNTIQDAILTCAQKLT